MDDDTTPVWGTPGGPDRPAPEWGTPEPGPGLMTAGTVLVTERSGFLAARSYDLTTPDGDPLATLTEQTGPGSWFFGSVAPSRFELLDPRGRPIATMERPGTWGRTEFAVADHTGREIGRVQESSRWLSTELDFLPATGRPMRMVGGGLGSGGWRLVDAVDPGVELARVTGELAGLGEFLAGTQRFAVLLSPALAGGHRLLALMAAACMDYLRDQQHR